MTSTQQSHRPAIGFTTRRGGLVLLAAAAIGLGGMLASPAASAATVIRVGLAQPTFSFIPLDVAIASGILKKHGVTVEKTVFHGSSQLHQAIAAGSIDVGLGAGPEFGFVAKGSPELAVAAMADAPRDLDLTVLKDSPIKTPADLKGKRISISTMGSLTQWAGQELSIKQGWGPHGINLVPLGSFIAQTAALKTHQIDGMIVAAGTADRLVEAGVGRTLVNFGNIVKNFHIHVIFASDAFMKEHPQDLRNFLAAWFETIHYMRTHKAETVKVASKVLSLSPALSGNLYDELMPMYNTTGRFEPKALATLAEATVIMGEFKTKPDMSKLYTEKFLPAAK